MKLTEQLRAGCEFHNALLLGMSETDDLMRQAADEIDALMAQNARIPRSGLALAELLAQHRIIQSHAIDDAEDYDGGVMLDRIYAAHSEMVSEKPCQTGRDG